MPNSKVYPVEMAAIYPSAWATPTTAYDARPYADVEIQVIGTPSVAYTPTRSFDNATFTACNAYDKDGNALSSISAAGIYRIPGNAYLKMGAGSGSTFYIRVGG